MKLARNFCCVPLQSVADEKAIAVCNFLATWLVDGASVIVRTVIYDGVRPIRKRKTAEFRQKMSPAFHCQHRKLHFTPITRCGQGKPACANIFSLPAKLCILTCQTATVTICPKLQRFLNCKSMSLLTSYTNYVHCPRRQMCSCDHFLYVIPLTRIYKSCQRAAGKKISVLFSQPGESPILS